MESNTVYCCPNDEDIFARLLAGTKIVLDKKKMPSQAIYIDEDGVFFHIKLDKETKQAVMRPTGKILSGDKMITVPIASIVMHLKKKNSTKANQ